MASKAYLIKETNVKTTDDELILKKKTLEKTPTFNLTNDWKILNLFEEYGSDNTNSDLNGELVMDKDSWTEMLNSITLSEFNSSEMEIIEKITADLKDRKMVFYECF